MAVLLETSKGDIVIDLMVEEAPMACKNFLKLCKIKYYNNCLFHNVQPGFIAQTGDPTGTGRGGDSIWGVLFGQQARFFDDEIKPHLKHDRRGLVGMASAGKNLNASQFYLTLTDAAPSLDEKRTIFGSVGEGLDVLEEIGAAFVDDAGRPYQNIRIRHTHVLEDPFDDPPQLAEHVPDASPEPQFEHGDRLEEDWVPAEDTRPAEEVEAEARKEEARARAVVLEMIGDLPEADAAPPPNVLFVCKLNPVTTEEDLEIIFGRFGAVTSCDIVRDAKTGESLCYAFVGFDTEAACENAYFKMNNVLIDDRRIKVDFSQSVHHLWRQFRRHGRRGDAAAGAEADAYERGGGGGGRGGGGGGGRGGSGGRGGGGGGSNLELKRPHAGGGYGGGSGSGAGPGPGVHANGRGGANAGSSGRGGAERGHERDSSYERRRERDSSSYERRHDRDRSRERRHDRDRSRERRREHDSSYERRRERDDSRERRRERERRRSRSRSRDRRRDRDRSRGRN